MKASGIPSFLLGAEMFASFFQSSPSFVAQANPFFSTLSSLAQAVVPGSRGSSAGGSQSSVFQPPPPPPPQLSRTLSESEAQEQASFLSPLSTGLALEGPVTSALLRSLQDGEGRVGNEYLIRKIVFTKVCAQWSATISSHIISHRWAGYRHRGPAAGVEAAPRRVLV